MLKRSKTEPMNYISNALETYRFMNDKNILIAFTGHIDQHVTRSLLKNIKSKLSLLEIKTDINKKIYSVLVESIENISQHSSKDDRAIFLLGKSDTSFNIVTGNHIPNENIPALKEKLDKMSEQDQKGLKGIFHKLSKRKDPSSVGLGIIGMAIKSGGKITYNFHQVNTEVSFYLLQVEISIE